MRDACCAVFSKKADVLADVNKIII